MTRAKRVMDVCGSLAGLVVLAPLFVLVGIAIAVDGWEGGSGSVLFAQERVGLRGSRFRMWKFRTMVADAERRGAQLTVGADPRITRVGRWLRRLKLDELPQLFNVLRGEMSLVGPRPEVPRFVALYTEAQRAVLELVPGITDPASIRYRDEASELARAADPERCYIEEIMPEKIHLNLEYAKIATPWTDLLVVLSTIGLVAGRRSGGGDSTALRRSTIVA
ncbi:MAG TPA: sugar transferase [Gemmatimonadaceae bacterium]|nr:sugar transferase [Gemmatimonadaceae bacterium]